MNFIPGMNSSHSQLILLAPTDVHVPGSFTAAEWNPERYAFLLGSAQRLRGTVYSEDGAVDARKLTADGRHVHPVDGSSWHIIDLNEETGEVNGCARYHAHSRDARFSDTSAAQSALGHSAEWAGHLKASVEAEMETAARLGIDFVEVGGWAITPQLRCTAEALRIALATFSMSRLLGGCLGLTTATRRHCSASILRRIGGQPLKAGPVEIPSYFDPQYDCQMELLRFDSSRPNPRFEPWIEGITNYLADISVITAVPSLRGLMHADPLRQNAPATAA